MEYFLSLGVTYNDGLAVDEDPLLSNVSEIWNKLQGELSPLLTLGSDLVDFFGLVQAAKRIGLDQFVLTGLGREESDFNRTVDYAPRELPNR